LRRCKGFFLGLPREEKTEKEIEAGNRRERGTDDLALHY